jgi:hypothetical protein
VAAHGRNPPMDCRIRQTATASPAEPGDLFWMLADNWVDQKIKTKYLELLKDFEIGH